MGPASQSRAWVGYGYIKKVGISPQISNQNTRRVGVRVAKKSSFPPILGCVSGSLRLPHLVQYHKINWFCPWSLAKLL